MWGSAGTCMERLVHKNVLEREGQGRQVSASSSQIVLAIASKNPEYKCNVISWYFPAAPQLRETGGVREVSVCHSQSPSVLVVRPT